MPNQNEYYGGRPAFAPQGTSARAITQAAESERQSDVPTNPETTTKPGIGNYRDHLTTRTHGADMNSRHQTAEAQFSSNSLEGQEPRNSSSARPRFSASESRHDTSTARADPATTPQKSHSDQSRYMSAEPGYGGPGVASPINLTGANNMPRSTNNNATNGPGYATYRNTSESPVSARDVDRRSSTSAKAETLAIPWVSMKRAQDHQEDDESDSESDSTEIRSDHGGTWSAKAARGSETKPCSFKTCLKQPSKGKDYCADHAYKCLDNACRRRSSSRNWVCEDHRCGECEKLKSSNSKFCSVHECINESCHKLKATGSLCCMIHKCGHPACLQRQQRQRLFCNDHNCEAKTTCYQMKKVVAKGHPGVSFCDAHKCRNESCDKEASGESRYCNSHKCAILPCTQARLRGVDQKFCAMHKCRDETCSEGHNITVAYCARHCCSEFSLCNTQRLQNKAHCKDHACNAYEWCKHKAVIPGGRCAHHR